jgi:hypothetical protein
MGTHPRSFWRATLLRSGSPWKNFPIPKIYMERFLQLLKNEKTTQIYVEISHKSLVEAVEAKSII